MTDKKILQYAFHGALCVWTEWKEKLDKYKENEYFKALERKAWNELEIIETMLKKAENK